MHPRELSYDELADLHAELSDAQEDLERAQGRLEDAMCRFDAASAWMQTEVGKYRLASLLQLAARYRDGDAAH